jgi:hypothetical protein
MDRRKVRELGRDAVTPDRRIWLGAWLFVGSAVASAVGGTLGMASGIFIRFGAIATFVLAIIILGAALGMHMAGTTPG